MCCRRDPVEHGLKLQTNEYQTTDPQPPNEQVTLSSAESKATGEEGSRSLHPDWNRLPTLETRELGNMNRIDFNPKTLTHFKDTHR
jgi:hypothetical protein